MGMPEMQLVPKIRMLEPITYNIPGLILSQKAASSYFWEAERVGAVIVVYP